MLILSFDILKKIRELLIPPPSLDPTKKTSNRMMTGASAKREKKTECMISVKK